MSVVKQRKPKRVSVLELGAGDKPYGIIGQAKRALKKRWGRTFEASDLVALPEVTFREFGLREMPKNAKVMRQCSIKHLNATPANSMDIVFGGYFLNGVRNSEGRKFDFEEKVDIIKGIKRVLKKRGRLILVVDQGALELYREYARQSGFSIHVMPFKERHFEQSHAHFIERRSSPYERRQMINDWIRMGQETPSNLEREAAHLGLKNVEDLAYPQIVVMSKK
jgi:hypothetical protein